MNDGLLVEDVAEIDVSKLLTRDEAWEAMLIVWYRDHPAVQGTFTNSRTLPAGEGSTNDGSGFYARYGVREICSFYISPNDPSYNDRMEYCRKEPKTIYWQDTNFLGLPAAIRTAAVLNQGLGLSANVETWLDDNKGDGFSEWLPKSRYLMDKIVKYYDPSTFSGYEGFMKLPPSRIPAAMAAYKKDERSITALEWMLRYLDLSDIADMLDLTLAMIKKYMKPLPPIPKSELNWQQDWLASAKKYAAWYRHNIVQAEVRIGIDALISICDSLTAMDLMEMKYNAQQTAKYIA